MMMVLFYGRLRAYEKYSYIRIRIYNTLHVGSRTTTNPQLGLLEAGGFPAKKKSRKEMMIFPAKTPFRRRLMFFPDL